MPHANDARLVTLFGGSGFLGRAAVEALARGGWRIRVVARNIHRAHGLKPLGDLGQIQVAGGDVRSAEDVARALDGADAAINFVGILAPSQGRSFDAIHRGAPALIAREAARLGVRRLLHVSAIGADPASPSAYGRSKGEGELAVREFFPRAAIVRPSIVSGPDDQFTNRFANLISLFPIVPVIAPGTRFQPVHVGDVAQALARLANRDDDGVWELGGPEVFTMRQINELIAGIIGANKRFIDVPAQAAALIAKAGFLPGAPLTEDQWLMLQRDNVVSPGVPGLEALGVTPTPLGATAPDWLVRFRRGGRFAAQRQNPQPSGQ